MPDTCHNAGTPIMLETQLRSHGIHSESVLAALNLVPREEFIPLESRDRAYEDGSLPIGHGQTISQPYIVALMTEQLEPAPHQKVLEVGTGSGYQTAVLSSLVREIYSVEIVEPLARQAATVLARLGFTNIHLRLGDGYLGWPDAAPFDTIIVTCAPDHVPQPLVDQLSDGGHLVIPVGEPGGIQKLIRLTKTGDGLRRDDLLDVRFVPLVRHEGN